VPYLQLESIETGVASEWELGSLLVEGKQLIVSFFKVTFTMCGYVISENLFFIMFRSLF
jgi:hypothetical protein